MVFKFNDISVTQMDRRSTKLTFRENIVFNINNLAVVLFHFSFDIGISRQFSIEPALNKKNDHPGEKLCRLEGLMIHFDVGKPTKKHHFLGQ